MTLILIITNAGKVPTVNTVLQYSGITVVTKGNTVGTVIGVGGEFSQAYTAMVLYGAMIVNKMIIR